MGKIAQNAQRKEIFLEALKKSLGVVQTACDMSKIPRRTVYDWIERDSEFARAFDECQDVAADFVESKMFELIRGCEIPEDKIFQFQGVPVIVPTIKRYPPDSATVIYYQKTKGRRRGYGSGDSEAARAAPETLIQVFKIGNQEIKF